MAQAAAEESGETRGVGLVGCSGTHLERGKGNQPRRPHPHKRTRASPGAGGRPGSEGAAWEVRLC